MLPVVGGICRSNYSPGWQDQRRQTMTENTTIVAFEDVLEGLGAAVDRCRRKLLRIDEARNIIAEADLKLEELLPTDSTAFRIYERSKREDTLWWTNTMSQYVDHRDCANIETWVKIVREVINEYEPDFLHRERSDKSQYFLSAGDVYRAKKTILRIMKRARTSLIIVDPYLDEDIFDYVDALDISVTIQFVTSNVKPMFKQLYRALQTSRSNIEVKVCHLFHDRFLVIDGSEIWSIGASINGAGKKAFVVDKIFDPNESNRLSSDIKMWCSESTAI